MSHELDELSNVLKITLEENTMVLFKVPADECSNVGKNLDAMNHLFKKHGITALVCPSHYEVVVINPKEKQDVN